MINQLNSNNKEFKLSSYVFIILLIAIIIVGLYLIQEDYYKFKEKVTKDVVMNYLLIYAVIAALIERFSNNVVLTDGHQGSKIARSILKRSTKTLKDINLFSAHDLEQAENKSLKDSADQIKEHNKNFFWISFFIAAGVSSFGFRFFSNILISAADNQVHMAVDIFLSAILMSGGALYIKSLLQILSDTKT